MGRCPDCWADLPAGARYCAMCGRPLRPAGPPAAISGAILPASRPASAEPPPAPQAGAAWLSALTLVGALLLGFWLVVGHARAAGPGPPALTAPVAAVRADLPPVPATPTPSPALPAYALFTIDVPAGGSYNLTFSPWAAGTVFEGYVLLAADTVGFRIQKPDGGDLVALPSLRGRYDFDVTAPEAGRYVVAFDDRASPLAGRQVTLIYRTVVPTER